VKYVLWIMTVYSVLGVTPFMFGMFDSGGLFQHNYLLVFICLWAIPLSFITMVIVVIGIAFVK